MRKVLLLLTLLFAVSTALEAQQAPDMVSSQEQIQSRIERARALIAAHRLDIAASELESVRAATQDSAGRNITSIMLMSVYLEEGNYGRAEALLEESYQARGPQKDEMPGSYFALAGQAVNGARTHLGRYRSFGVNTSDTNLPAEAVNDLNRLRSLLERMIAQAKEISSGRKTYDSLSLLEDVLGIRLSLAKDSEDQTRWETEYAIAREALASSQTQIASLGGVPPLRTQSPVSKIAPPSPYSTKKTSDTPLQIKTPETKSTTEPGMPETADSSPSNSAQPANPDESKKQTAVEATDSASPINAGSLNAKASKRVVPLYPTLAKQSGAVGLVRVHVIVDETGKVIAISRSEGPLLLRPAAEAAARQWAFEGISNDDRPARFSGYIDFNFTL